MPQKLLFHMIKQGSSHSDRDYRKDNVVKTKGAAWMSDNPGMWRKHAFSPSSCWAQVHRGGALCRIQPMNMQDTCLTSFDLLLWLQSRRVLDLNTPVPPSVSSGRHLFQYAVLSGATVTPFLKLWLRTPWGVAWYEVGGVEQKLDYKQESTAMLAALRLNSIIMSAC